MRRGVVLPAPLGPSRPVIWPSRASKPTPETAWTTPVRVLKLLWRSWAMIIAALRWRGGGASGLPSVEAGEGRYVAHAVQAARIQRGGIGAFQELAEHARHATQAEGAVALAAQDQVAAIGQAFQHACAEARRGHRIQLARQQQRRHVRAQRRGEVLRAAAMRPGAARGEEH